MEAIRLGDTIDDHCSRCRLLTDHSVVALIGEEVKKVRCRTCNDEHNFRHGKGGQKKKPKLSAYEQVLASVMASMPGAAAANAEDDAPTPRPAPRTRTRYTLPRRNRPLPRR
ncbi:MAG: hypothetical protein IIA14_06385 [SAR324 cluster bacterium]|nr:hypothetical protein [SAR324 cluster bacterium]